MFNTLDLHAILDKCHDYESPLAPASEQRVTKLIEACEASFGPVVDSAAAGYGGIICLEEIEKLPAQLVPSSEIQVRALKEISAPLPSPVWTKVGLTALKTFASADHPDASLKVSTFVRWRDHPHGQCTVDLLAEDSQLTIRYVVADQPEAWIAQLATLLDPGATLAHKEGRLYAVSASGSTFTHSHDWKTGELLFLRLSFPMDEPERAIEKYEDLLHAPGIRIASQRFGELTKSGRSERLWKLEIRQARKSGRSTFTDDWNLASVLPLPAAGGDVWFSWHLNSYKCWRAMHSLPAKRPGCILFVFQCSTKQWVAFELWALQQSGKFKVEFRFENQADAAEVYKGLGIKPKSE